MFKIVRSFVGAILALLMGLLSQDAVRAEQYGGLLGVYAKETGNGLLVTGFIAGSSADDLHQAGEIKVGDVMLRLDGRPLRRGADVFRVTDLLEAGADYVDLDMVTRTGFPYRLAITPTAGPGVDGARPYSFPANATAADGASRATVKTEIVVKESRNRLTDAPQRSASREQSDRDQYYPPTGRPRD